MPLSPMEENGDVSCTSKQRRREILCNRMKISTGKLVEEGRLNIVNCIGVKGINVLS